MHKVYLALGLGLALVACGSGDDFNRGGAGESCVSHNDCAGGLACYNYICSAAPAQSTQEDGGATTVTPGPVLSKSGESCTKRADCETGLGCFGGVCALTQPAPAQADAAIIYVTVDAGAPVPTNPVLGGRGETCTKSADCAVGLICLPGGDSTSLGVCDKANYGLQTGTKVCGAECMKDLDCMELPVGTTGTALDGGTTAYNSCADLVKVLTLSSTTAATCADVPAVARECFLYKTYCDTVTLPLPWTCTTTGRCTYNRNCTVSTETLNGCPAQTRTGGAVPACNATSNKCADAVVAAGCVQSDDCITRGTSDGAGPCVSGECVCIAEQGTCYRKCNADLDCRQGYTCDLTKQVCTPAGECTTDAYCAVASSNVTAMCVIPTGATGGSCKIPCKIDQDCSPSGGLSTSSTSAFNGTVCGADGYCGGIGCTSDAECSVDMDGTKVKTFCTAPVVSAVVEYASAITD